MTPPQEIEERELYVLHARICRTVAHPDRLRLLQALRDGERTVGELVAATGLAQSVVSRHLGQLRGVGVVTARREGVQVYYRLTSQRVLEAYNAMRAFTYEYLNHQAQLVQALEQAGEEAEED